MSLALTAEPFQSKVPRSLIHDPPRTPNDRSLRIVSAWLSRRLQLAALRSSHTITLSKVVVLKTCVHKRVSERPTDVGTLHLSVSDGLQTAMKIASHLLLRSMFQYAFHSDRLAQWQWRSLGKPQMLDMPLPSHRDLVDHRWAECRDSRSVDYRCPLAEWL